MNDLSSSSNLSKQNATLNFKFEVFNLGLVFKFASVINFSILLAVFFFCTSLKSGFYKICVSYEFLERKILKLYQDFNENTILKSNKIVYKSGSYLFIFTIIYLFIAISLQIGYFLIAKNFNLLFIISTTFKFKIMIVIVVFVFSNNFLLYCQINALHRYICSFQNQYFNISAFNLIHIELYKHFQVSMKYIPYLYLFIYFQVLLQALSSDVNFKNFSIINFYEFGQIVTVFILPITFLAILISYKVNL
jgi:hypothetical protein